MRCRTGPKRPPLTKVMFGGSDGLALEASAIPRMRPSASCGIDAVAGFTLSRLRRGFDNAGAIGAGR